MSGNILYIMKFISWYKKNNKKKNPSLLTPEIHIISSDTQDK